MSKHPDRLKLFAINENRKAGFPVDNGDVEVDMGSMVTALAADDEIEAVDKAVQPESDNKLAW